MRRARSRDPIELRRFAGHVDHEEQLSHLRIAHLTDPHGNRFGIWKPKA